MKNFKAKLFGVSLFVLTLAASCNHDFNKVVPASPGFTAGTTFKTPKVLYIIADGARGTSVRDADIPTLKSLIPNAIYSWTSLSDATVSTDATNWADMITGVKKEKHNVLTEDFAGNNLATYPAIFQRIKAVKPTTRIAAFSASSAFKANLTGGTDVSETFTSDDAVKTRMVDFLKADTASLVVGEFAGIETAGKAVGFDNSFPAYKAAISTFDTQLGAILASIKGRATYAKENWLIIVSSNKGGQFTLPPAQDDKTVFSNTSANTFTIIYNSTFNPTFIAKPFVGNSYVGNSVRFLGYPEQGTGRVSAALSPNFNFGDTAGFTISVKVKKHKNPVTISRGDYYYNWPGFMGKRGKNGGLATGMTGWGNDGSNNAGSGWDFCLIQNTWRFFLAGKTGTGYQGGSEILGVNFTGDTWHDLTAVIERKPDGHKYVRVYTDGVMGITSRGGGSLASPLTTAYDLAGDGAANGTDVNLDNNSILRVGYTPGEMDGGTSGSTFGKIDVELKELKIFKTAIPDGAVKQFACDQTIDISNPYYPYLIGYWPMDEGTGTVLHDKGPIAADMTLGQNQTNGYTWQSFQDLICSPVASNLALLVPKNSDLPTQILSWFNIARQSSWSLDGKVWIAN